MTKDKLTQGEFEKCLHVLLDSAGYDRAVVFAISTKQKMSATIVHNLNPFEAVALFELGKMEVIEDISKGKSPV